MVASALAPLGDALQLTAELVGIIARELAWSYAMPSRAFDLRGLEVGGSIL